MASVPAGASTGTHEAKEARDNDPDRYAGLGVLQACATINETLAGVLIGQIPDVIALDAELLSLDSSPDKSVLGANTLLAVSLAVAKAEALAKQIEVFELVAKLAGGKTPHMPSCLYNIINGGLHADGGLAVQEFLIQPLGIETFSQGLERAVRVYNSVKTLCAEKELGTAVGDEGGLVPRFKEKGLERECAALDILMQAIGHAGLEPGKDIALGIDVAATSLFDAATNSYQVHDREYTSAELIEWYRELSTTYPLTLIEDGLAEDDWSGWRALTQTLSPRVTLVGDDIFATTTELIEKGAEQGVATASVIKPNQVGTIRETLQAIAACRQSGFNLVVSHRSGETNDTFIADFAAGVSAEMFKGGAPVRGERVAKYNRLLQIERDLG